MIGLATLGSEPLTPHTIKARAVSQITTSPRNSNQQKAVSGKRSLPALPTVVYPPTLDAFLPHLWRHIVLFDDTFRQQFV